MISRGTGKSEMATFRNATVPEIFRERTRRSASLTGAVLMNLWEKERQADQKEQKNPGCNPWPFHHSLPGIHAT